MKDRDKEAQGREEEIKDLLICALEWAEGNPDKEERLEELKYIYDIVDRIGKRPN